MGIFSLLSFLIFISLGTLYPIYLSYKAMKADDLASLKVLLIYWIVMGSFIALETTFGWLINWFPLYYEVKTILMLWLTLPQVQGSRYIYMNYLRPLLIKHESTLDQILVQIKVRCKQLGLAYLPKSGKIGNWDLVQLLQFLPSGPTTKPSEPTAKAKKFGIRR